MFLNITAIEIPISSMMFYFQFSPNGLPPSGGDEYISDIPLDSLPNARMTFTNPLLTKNNCSLLKTRVKLAEVTASSVLVSRLDKLYSLLQSDNVVVSSVLSMTSTYIY